MPLDRPVLPGEQEIDLAGATLTSGGCTGSALAIDDDPATGAVFGAPDSVASPISLVPSLFSSLFNTGVDGTGQILADGARDPHWQVAYPAQDTTGQAYLGPWPVQPAVVQNSEGGRQTTADARVISNIAAFGQSNGGAWLYATAFTADQPITGLVARIFEVDNGVTSITVNGVENLGTGGGPAVTLTRGFRPGQNAVVVTVRNLSDGSLLVQDLGVEWVSVLRPAPRFLRVDWGYDAFVSRVRLAYSGPGAGNVGVDYESSLAYYESSLAYHEGLPPPQNSGAGDVALSALPAPVDGNVHEVIFSPPVLGRGVVFSPDALLPGPSSQSVNLYQLQVYQDVTQPPGVFPMAKPSVTQARVGCSGAVITPRAANAPASYPFPQAQASTLQSIQSLSFGATSKLAREVGGDTVHQINGYETDREYKCKLSVQRHDYLALQNLQNGILVVNPANAGVPETQYFAPGYTDRNPYFSLVALSANGDPSALFVMPKCKLDGNLSANLERDKTTTFDVDLVLFWDFNYTRQDGALGGIYEQIFNNGGAAALHS